MSNAKTGGNKKSASPSDENYWKRAQAGGFAETHRAKRMARHAKRMGLTKAQMGEATKPVTFPHRAVPSPLERVTFTGQVMDLRVWARDRDGDRHVAKMPHMIIKNGVVTDVIGVSRRIVSK